MSGKTPTALHAARLFQQVDSHHFIIMKNFLTLTFIAASALLLASCGAHRSGLNSPSYAYTPADPELYNTISRLDSVFWDAYNTCDLKTQAKLYADSIEFYHDQGGLITSKQAILEATKLNICGKIRRDLVKGSLEVYPIRGFGAVEMGMHTFQNITDKANTPSRPGRFVIIWQQHKDKWTIKRVISLH